MRRGNTHGPARRCKKIDFLPLILRSPHKNHEKGRKEKPDFTKITRSRALIPSRGRTATTSRTNAQPQKRNRIPRKIRDYHHPKNKPFREHCLPRGHYRNHQRNLLLLSEHGVDSFDGGRPADCRHNLVLMWAVLEIARELGVIYTNPAVEIAKARVKQKRLELPSAEQFQEIVKRIITVGARWSLNCAEMVRFLTYSGARLRQATALRWGHVNLARNQITIFGTKSGSSYRILPLFPALAALLAEIKNRRGPDTDDAPILRVGGCLGALESACESVGLKPINHQDLRHLFATRCIECGVDIPTVSHWLGHGDGGVFAMQTYGQLRQEHSALQATKVHFRLDARIREVGLIFENRYDASLGKSTMAIRLVTLAPHFGAGKGGGFASFRVSALLSMV
jgi:integrase